MRTRGSALLVTMIVLAVLTLVGVASLQLAQGDSITVNRQMSYRTQVACSEAAVRKVWAAYALKAQVIYPYMVDGTQSPSSGDGGIVLAPGHYDSDVGGPSVSVTFDDQVLLRLGAAAMSGGVTDIDTTNTFREPLLGSPMTLIAHCRDRADRQYEIELAVRFGL